MPTYEYRCRDCGDQLEVVQAFTDATLTECGTCGGSLRKLFSAVGISFKGAGFYKTDSRNGSGEKRTEKGDKSDKSEKTEKAATNGSGAKDGAASTADKGSGDAKAASTATKDASSTKAPGAKPATPAKTG